MSSSPFDGLYQNGQPKALRLYDGIERQAGTGQRRANTVVSAAAAHDN
jgi:hypothetical protein